MVCYYYIDQYVRPPHTVPAREKHDKSNIIGNNGNSGTDCLQVTVFHKFTEFNKISLIVNQGCVVLKWPRNCSGSSCREHLWSDVTCWLIVVRGLFPTKWIHVGNKWLPCFTSTSTATTTATHVRRPLPTLVHPCTLVGCPEVVEWENTKSSVQIYGLFPCVYMQSPRGHAFCGKSGERTGEMSEQGTEQEHRCRTRMRANEERRTHRQIRHVLHDESSATVAPPRFVHASTMYACTYTANSFYHKTTMFTSWLTGWLGPEQKEKVACMSSLCFVVLPCSGL